MSVFLVSSGLVKPGRINDFTAQAVELSKLYQRLGSPPPRLFMAGFAGESFGQWTYSVEFDDLESFGAQIDEWATDPELQQMQVRVQESDAPQTITNVTLMSELAVRAPKPGRGSVLSVYVSKPHPGGVERTVELGIQACEFAEKHGAVNARLYTLFGAGVGAGLHMTTWESGNMSSRAKLMAAFVTDAAGQAIAAEASGAKAPSTLVFEAVYTEIPI